ncbi:MAG: hypothetical protein QME06_05910, partial [Desulfobacterales bacterium]|nr:hypothetical protein [Desulfobacterales bacterium]
GRLIKSGMTISGLFTSSSYSVSAKRLYKAYKHYIFVFNIFYVWYLKGKSYNYLLPRTLSALFLAILDKN